LTLTAQYKERNPACETYVYKPTLQVFFQNLTIRYDMKYLYRSQKLM